MLTFFQETTYNAFQKILNFFVKENSTVLDITYGRGLSWKYLNKNYKIIKVDKRRLFKDVIQSDLKDYLRNKKNSSVDCVYFDPPYYFKDKIKNYNIKNQMLNVEDEVFLTEKEFELMLCCLKENIPRILKNKGIFIAKLMNGCVGKIYYPNAFNLFNVIEKVMKPKGVFICPIKRGDNLNFVRENHIYYLVFQNGGDVNEL